MKKTLQLILIIGLWASAVNALAQSDSLHVAPVTPYSTTSNALTSLAIGTGINSNVGLLGLQIEHKTNGHFSFYGGAGLGGWGYKLSLGTRFYFSKKTLGSALGLSFSNATGANGVKNKLNVIESGKEQQKEITFNAKPVNLLNISWLRYWKMGRDNRFSLEIGYSFLLTQPESSNYTITTPNITLTDESKSVLKAVQPGGILIAVGFNFGL